MSARRFTKDLRKQIVDAFIAEHGHWNPDDFLADVRAKGPSHPAYEWFQWDDEAAADEYRREQARKFGQGIRIVTTVRYQRTEGRKVVIAEKQVAAPYVMSPVENRSLGGGYIRNGSADFLPSLCREAAQALDAWAKRYQLVIIHAGLDPDVVANWSAALLDAQNPSLKKAA